MNIILLSYTPLNDSGGVPKFNRDFISFFKNTKHYCYFDIPGVTGYESLQDWERAKVLNQYLIHKKLITKDDIIICDGFWGNGLEDWTGNLVIHRHGIYGHVTATDLEKGINPEFPLHHQFQVEFTKKHLKNGGRVTAVSDFIAYEMKEQWGWENISVINNGVDLNIWKPRGKIWNNKFQNLIIHGVNDYNNSNKGGEHIKYLKENLKDINIFSLDEAAKEYNLSKQEVLAQADLVVHPSNFEANSMFCLEVLASGVPLVAYNVGLLWKYWQENLKYANGLDADYGFPKDFGIGIIMNRNKRSPKLTLKAVQKILELIKYEYFFQPREWVKQFSLDHFHKNWYNYLKKEFGYELAR